MTIKPLDIAKLESSAPGFDQQLARLLAWDQSTDQEIERRVTEIVSSVRQRGDAALLEYTARFDRRSVKSITELEVDPKSLQDALAQITKEQRNALEVAAQRIRNYHEKQLAHSWQYEEADGTLLGQKITPLQRVGLYVPGGKAAYPSTVLMNGIPAKVAGVEELVMVAPAPGGQTNPIVLAAAAIVGVDRVFSIGGAQAVAALAYGTQSIPKVDKIVGPGNIYVATAKKQVFGAVGIDMIAGPSEILVICDGQTDPEWIAMDLFSQAEHDEDAQAILLSPDAAFLDAVHQVMARELMTMERSQIARTSLERRGALVQVRDLHEAAMIANQIAPEHLELSVADPVALLDHINNAGAIFMGRYTAEAIGDYCAGPNHVLPTSSTARFSSPLGVYDFQKRSSLIMCSPQGAHDLGLVASRLAREEGLIAHARSAEYRIKAKT